MLCRLMSLAPNSGGRCWRRTALYGSKIFSRLSACSQSPRYQIQQYFVGLAAASMALNPSICEGDFIFWCPTNSCGRRVWQSVPCTRPSFESKLLSRLKAGMGASYAFMHYAGFQRLPATASKPLLWQFRLDSGQSQWGNTFFVDARIFIMIKYPCRICQKRYF